MTRLTIRWRVLSYLLGTDVSGGITDISYESFKMSSTTCLLRVVQYQSCSIPSDSEVQRCRRMREKEVCPWSLLQHLAFLQGSVLVSFHTTYVVVPILTGESRDRCHHCVWHVSLSHAGCTQTIPWLYDSLLKGECWLFLQDHLQEPGTASLYISSHFRNLYGICLLGNCCKPNCYKPFPGLDQQSWDVPHGQCGGWSLGILLVAGALWHRQSLPGMGLWGGISSSAGSMALLSGRFLLYLFY